VWKGKCMPSFSQKQLTRFIIYYYLLLLLPGRMG